MVYQIFSRFSLYAKSDGNQRVRGTPLEIFYSLTETLWTLIEIPQMCFPEEDLQLHFKIHFGGAILNLPLVDGCKMVYAV